MSTRNQPGQFDVFNKLAPEEPYFVLRANDRFAPALVALWANLAQTHGCGEAKITEAFECARAMQKWPERLKKFPD